MAPKKPVVPHAKPRDVPPEKMVEELPDDPLDEVTPAERRKGVPREAIALDAGGSPCVVCGTIGTGVCPVDGHARGGN